MKFSRKLLALAIVLPLIPSTSGLGAAELKIGDTAPTVSALDQDGRTVNLSDIYASNRYTLVFFYPRAFTRGCTAQSCSLRDGYEQLSELGVAIIGVSTDSVEKQHAFKKEYNLPYTLLSDPKKEIAASFGQSKEGSTAKRQAYLIKNGKIIYADHKGTTSTQAEAIIQFVRNIQ